MGASVAVGAVGLAWPGQLGLLVCCAVRVRENTTKGSAITLVYNYQSDPCIYPFYSDNFLESITAMLCICYEI